MSDLKQANKQGMTVKQMDQLLRQKGYTGKYSTLRIRVQDLRRQANKAAVQEKRLSRKQVIQLFWQSFESVSPKGRMLLNQLLTQYSGSRELYGFIQLFRDMITFHDIETFHYILSSGNNLFQNKDIHLFINKLKEDREAIYNAFIYKYNNGLLEGQLNRLKTIKRMMYGRASLELLKQRVLFGP